MEHSITKLALLGRSGVGKDTFVQILQQSFPHIALRQICLAKPLYEVQHFIYKICSKEISDDDQDGLLLNFLGKHMRLINPNVLLDRFAQSVLEVGSGVDMILCSDARPIDIPFIKNMGFTIVHIVADPQLSLERRIRRGDLSLGSNDYETEAGIVIGMSDIQITNNSTFKDYEKSVIQFLNDFLP